MGWCPAPPINRGANRIYAVFFFCVGALFPSLFSFCAWRRSGWCAAAVGAAEFVPEGLEQTMFLALLSLDELPSWAYVRLLRALLGQHAPGEQPGAVGTLAPPSSSSSSFAD
ncbi:uncharacterized protein Tco025E_09696 [Trypanosoma conorhini]|uniref:Uncharacterized protein n=1 Tax=Trypanosoma conorhini TaxID=83891 RepID=A0A422MTT3_9TRYP|nr:uncharacterized protein Tco025E_09696 [Trypanosoma conorhini]RNE96593.1 hypothetical protein Tco025E_09696 [Trypanosoma conorhini]